MNQAHNLYKALTDYLPYEQGNNALSLYASVVLHLRTDLWRDHQIFVGAGSFK